MILITGGNGQLGQHLSARLKNEAVSLSSHDLDITSREAIVTALDKYRPSTLINCAAYTAVDLAESERDRAKLVNATALTFIGEETFKRSIRVLHISTDYVFSGLSSPISETEEPKPVNYYGVTKLEGEKNLFAANSNSVVIRTGWVYSDAGKNFLNSMLHLAKSRTELGIVFDQIGTPTYAGDLADALVTVAAAGAWPSKEIFNYSNEGVASWYDFATQIFRLWDLPTKALPIRSANYPTPAPRPSFSVLDKAKIKKAFDLKIPHWQETLASLAQRSPLK